MPRGEVHTARAHVVEQDAIAGGLAPQRDRERVAGPDGLESVGDPQVGLVQPPRRRPRTVADHEVVPVGPEQKDLAPVLVVHADQRRQGGNLGSRGRDYPARRTCKQQRTYRIGVREPPGRQLHRSQSRSEDMPSVPLEVPEVRSPLAVVDRVREGGAKQQSGGRYDQRRQRRSAGARQPGRPGGKTDDAGGVVSQRVADGRAGGVRQHVAQAGVAPRHKELGELDCPREQGGDETHPQ